MTQPIEPTGAPGPSWAACAPEGATTAQALAARMGAYCAVEQVVFGLLGGWVVDIAEVDAKAQLAEAAEHAAWRAQRWYELVPAAPPGADALVVAPPAAVAVVDQVPPGVAPPAVPPPAVPPPAVPPPAVPPTAVSPTAVSPTAVSPTAVRLALAHRVLLGGLSVAYTAHLDWSPGASEVSVRRLLSLAVDDVAADRRHGERLLAALLAGSSPEAVAALAAGVGSAEAVVAAHGGLLGPATPGLRPV